MIKLNTKKILLLLTCIFSISITYYALKQVLFNKYTFIEDLRQNIYWMERSRDPKVFEFDLIADFAGAFASPLLKFIYKLISFVDVQKLSVLLSFPLCLISAIYMFKLGEKIKGPYCGFFAGTIFVLSAWVNTSFEYFGLGNSGDFFPVLTIVFLYYFYIDNLFAMAFILILQAFIYPPIFLISLICFTISALASLNTRKIICLLFTILISFVVLFYSFKISQTNNFGNTYTIQEIKQMQEFTEGGRIPLIYSSLSKRIFNNRNGIGELNGRLGKLSLLTIIAILLSIKNTGFLFPRKINILFLSSLLLFILANIFILRLFEPARYLLVSLPLVLIIAISISFTKLIQRINKPQIKISLLITIFVCIFLLYFPKIRINTITITNKEFYTFLGSLPDNCLIAGNPYVMDNIPLLAKRKVLFTSELSYPYYKNYYQKIKEMTYSLFNAYYTDSFNKFLVFCKKNNINYFIVRKVDFTKYFLEKKMFYYLPFNEHIILLTSKKDTFALTKIPPDLACYEDKEYIVLNLN